MRFHIPSEAWPGIVLLASAIVAMILANSAWAPMQADFLQSHAAVSFRSIHIEMTLTEWVKNLLMAVFFFYVGLELKRELLEGALSSAATALLPLAAALSVECGRVGWVKCLAPQVRTATGTPG